MCLLYEPGMVWGMAMGNAAIFAAYMLIPWQLRGVYRQQPRGARRLHMWLLALFIFCCGVGHALMVLTLWVPVYHLLAVCNALTGVVSLTAAVVIPRAVIETREMIEAGHE